MKVLVVGNPNSVWVKYYIEQILLKYKEFDISISFLRESYCRFQDFYNKSKIRSVGEYSLNKYIMRIPKIRAAYLLHKRMHSIKEKYDLVIVIYSTVPNLLIASYAKKKTGKIIDLVIGSDILRASKWELSIINRILIKKKPIVVCSANKQADFMKNRMTCTKVLRISVIGFGLATTTYIDKYRTMNTSVLCEFFGIDANKLVICIGYNGGKVQQHAKVINQLCKMSDKEKKQLFVVVPMTYLREDDYCNDIDEQLRVSGLKYVILKDFLDFSEMARLWLSIDVFINAQTTDAMSASLFECIYAGVYVLNAKWLKYKELENANITLDGFERFEEIPQKIAEILLHPILRKHLNNTNSNGEEELQRFFYRWKELFNEEGIL